MRQQWHRFTVIEVIVPLFQLIHIHHTIVGAICSFGDSVMSINRQQLNISHCALCFNIVFDDFDKQFCWQSICQSYGCVSMAQITTTTNTMTNIQRKLLQSSTDIQCVCLDGMMGVNREAKKILRLVVIEVSSGKDAPCLSICTVICYSLSIGLSQFVSSPNSSLMKIQKNQSRSLNITCSKL